MRLVTYRQDGHEHVGVLDGESVFPVKTQRRVTMLDLIDSDELDIAAELATSSRPTALSEVQLLPPIPHARQNIICLGRNYDEHVQEMERSGRDAVSTPTFFTKAVTTVIGPADLIPY